MENKFEHITPCGECCDGCQKFETGQCQGCLSSAGHCREWEGTGRCPVYACAQAHGALFCGVCSEFPCADLSKKIHWDQNIVARLMELAGNYREENNRRCPIPQADI